MSYRTDVERERQFLEGMVAQSRDRVLYRDHGGRENMERELDNLEFCVERLALFNHTHPKERVVA